MNCAFNSPPAHPGTLKACGRCNRQTPCLEAAGIDDDLLNKIVRSRQAVHFYDTKGEKLTPAQSATRSKIQEKRKTGWNPCQKYGCSCKVQKDGLCVKHYREKHGEAPYRYSRTEEQKAKRKLAKEDAGVTA